MYNDFSQRLMAICFLFGLSIRVFEVLFNTREGSVLSHLKREAQPSVLDMIKHDCSSVLNDFKYAAL